MAQAARIQTQKRPAVQAAIIFVARASIRPAIRQELKTAQVAEIYTPETLEACIEHLVKYDAALLVIDWDHGLEVLNCVLKAAQGSFNIDTRPIFMIAAEIAQEVIAVGAEYNVARIHTGEISRGILQAHIEAILGEESDDTGLRALLTRVADARRRGDWEAAGELLTELQSMYPDNRRINCELVENLMHAERWDEAAAVVDALTVTDGQNLRVQHLKARYLMKQGRFDAAAALLQSCQLVNPYNVDRLVDLGRALLHVDKYKEALQSFDEALRLDAGSTEAHAGKVQCKLLQGDVNDALRLMRELGAHELAALFNNAAILAIRSGRFEQGKCLYTTGIGTLGDKETATARLFYNLGLAHHKSGREGEALDCFERACLIDPVFEKARHNAAAVAHKLGKKPNLPPSLAVVRPQNIDDSFVATFDEEKIHKS